MVWRLSFSQAIYQFVVQEQLKTHDEVRAKLEGEVVVIDLLNQALNFGNGHDAVRRAACAEAAGLPAGAKSRLSRLEACHGLSCFAAGRTEDEDLPL